MESPNVLFIMLPFPSHYLACFPYAKTLLREGKLVIFTGSVNQKKIVEAEGFSFREVTYTSEYTITSFKIFIALLLQSIFDKTAFVKRFKAWLNSVRTMDVVLQTTSPVKVYMDDHLWHYYPMILKRCPSIEIINTKLSTKKSVAIPPLDSSFIPKSSFLSQVICEILWFNHLMRLRIRESLVRVAHLNRDEDYFTERLAKKLGLDLSKLIDRRNCFYRGLRGVKVLVLAPRSLEFPHKLLKPNEYYLDVPIDRNEEHLFSRQYIDFASESKVLKTEGKKIIYCSFGTLGYINEKRVTKFAHLLFSILEREKNWHLIFSTGGIRFERIPRNVVLFDQVPQLSLLKNCNLMITHGGLTSIKECIQNGVPMLVYPLNEKVDQKGNAARVNFHGLGLRGNISSDSLENTWKKITSLLQVNFVHK